MAKEQVKAFIERMKSDAAFSKSIMSIKNPDDRIKAIVSAGYDTNAEELDMIDRATVGERSSCNYQCIVQGVHMPNPKIKDVRSTIERKR
ncbi:MAG: Nif11-like leader peptide family natural product precursor [Candidatus Chlorobium antarcticum]|jgi:predicted ribosomally synthesized peptide with nif11-like leader|nr:Nif11-like leader peptide family natural product precursor [Candidatus Chlorobium antarcticum]